MPDSKSIPAAGVRVNLKKALPDVPKDTKGTVIATLPYTFTVEWDTPSLYKNAFDGTTGKELLEVINEEVDEDDEFRSR